MIFSKGAFTLWPIGGDGAEFISLAKDGTAFAANNNAWVAVSPLPDDVKKALPFKSDGWNIEDGKGICVTADTAKNVLKSLPKDTVYSGLLENADVKLNGSEAEFETHDGKRKFSIAAKAVKFAKIPFLWIKKAILESKTESTVIVNRKRLLDLLEIADKAVPDPGKAAPLWITVTKDGKLILRGVNPRTDQRFIGVMSAFDEKDWLVDSEWEKSFTEEKPKPVGCRKRTV